MDTQQFPSDLNQIPNLNINPKPTKQGWFNKKIVFIVVGVVVIVAAVVGVVFWWWQNGIVESVSNYEECVKAPGSRMLLTYLEQCVTKDGETFTKPIDGTSDWKTYTNTADANFSIQYPQTWKFTQQTDAGKTYAVNFIGAEGNVYVVWGDGFGGGYCTDPDNLGLKIQPYFLTQQGLSGCSITRPDGIKSWFLFKEISTGLSIVVRANVNDASISVVSDEQLTERILSTFKFIEPGQGINSFEKCGAAGYPIKEMYPEQCTTPEGLTFVKHREGQVCVEVIARARNPQTGEVRDFPTPCDVPVGWAKI